MIKKKILMILSLPCLIAHAALMPAQSRVVYSSHTGSSSWSNSKVALTTLGALAVGVGAYLFKRWYTRPSPADKGRYIKLINELNKLKGKADQLLNDLAQDKNSANPIRSSNLSYNNACKKVSSLYPKNAGVEGYFANLTCFEDLDNLIYTIDCLNVRSIGENLYTNLMKRIEDLDSSLKNHKGSKRLAEFYPLDPQPKQPVDLQLKQPTWSLWNFVQSVFKG